MTDGVRIDTSELDALVADFGKHLNALPENIGKALTVTARNIKDDWRDRLKGSRTVPAGPYSVTYDLVGAASVVLGRSALSAEIGPVLGRNQGAIVGMLEYGTPNTGPRGFGLEALRANSDDFEKGIEFAVKDGLS